MKPVLLIIAPPHFAPLSMLAPFVGDRLEIVTTEDGQIARREIARAELLLVAPRSASLLSAIWSEADTVRWVHSLAVGVNGLLFPQLVASDAVLTNAQGVFDEALAEYVLTAMLYFAKDLARLRRNQAARLWEPFDIEMIAGKRLGVVGYGSIGRAVARRAAANGVLISAMKRSGGAPDGVADRMYDRFGLPHLLTESDYVVITLPLTSETRGLMGSSELALLAPHAILINIARGEVVDEDALGEALRQGRFRGAALDVFSTEPLPPEHPFWSLGNILLSPHCADHTADAHDRSMAFYLTNLDRYLKGETLLNVVDKRRGY